MKLSEIINIEYQLYIDARSDPALVRNRDREIGKTYYGPEADRVSLFRFWLKGMEDKHSYPGQSIDSALTFLRYLVFFFFMFSGATTCAGILSYNGSRPVNIVNFIAVFAGIEMLLYLFFVLNVLPGKIHNKIPFIGDFYRFAGFIFSKIIGTVSNHLFKNKTEFISQLTGTFYRARSRHMVYHNIERWTLFSLTQLAGFAFSIGALAACSYLITFSDLAFAWNTTLDVSPVFFHRIVSVISIPWAFLFEKLVPTIDLVESTRYFRLSGSYSGLHGSALTAGGWWPFLICILVFYGLIPRFLLLMLSRIFLLRAQRKVPFLSAEFDSLYRRLTYPIFSTRTDSVQHEKEITAKQKSRNPEGLSFKAEACYLIVWGECDIPEAEIKKIVEARFRWNILETGYAGMLDNLRDEETLRRFKDRNDDRPILILAESWEAPGKAMEHFLRRLRINEKDNRGIIIGLVNQDAEKHIISPSRIDWQNWQDAVARLNDPFICIEPVAEGII